MATPWLVTALLFATIHAGRCGQPSWLSRFDSVEGCETDICSGDNAGARAYRPFLPVHGVDPAFRQQSRSVGEFMASTYPANTVCTCAPSIRGNTYRVCGRLDNLGTGGIHGTTGLGMQTLLSKCHVNEISNSRHCFLQVAPPDMLTASEFGTGFVRGNGVLTDGQAQLVGARWFFDIAPPPKGQIRSAHFGLHFMVLYDDSASGSADPALTCHEQGLFSDYDLDGDFLADVAKAEAEILCGNAFGTGKNNAPGAPLFRGADIELCAVVSRGNTMTMVIEREVDTKRIRDIAWLSVTMPDGTIGRPRMSRNKFSVTRCDGASNHASLRAALKFQVNPAKQQYELLLTDGKWIAGDYRSSGSISSPLLIAAWPY